MLRTKPPSIMAAMAGIFISLSGCSPVLRPDHCANQSREQMRQTCSPSQICTNSQCPGLQGIAPEFDRGCREQNTVFSAVRSHSQATWGAWQGCLLGLRPSQSETLSRLRLASARQPSPENQGSTKEHTKSPSMVPDLQPANPKGNGTGSTHGGTNDSTSQEKGSAPQCSSDQECQGHATGPYCDVHLGACVACVPGQPSHCSDPERPICEDVMGRRSCQACSADLDCIRAQKGAFCDKRLKQGKYITQCVACSTDQHCAQVAARPHCKLPTDETPPRCVACVTDAQCEHPGQRCEKNACVGCSQLEGQCFTDAACWWWDGEIGSCSTQVIYVDSAPGVNCLLGNGSIARPFCRIPEALRAITPGQLSTIRIKGHHTLHRGLHFGANAKVQLIGNTRSRIELQASAESLMNLTDGAQVTLSRLELRTTQKYAVRCEGATTRLRLDNVRMSDGRHSALKIKGCSVKAQRVEISGFDQYAIEQQGGELRMAASILAGNGRLGAAQGGAIRLESRASTYLEHVTVAGNIAKGGPSVLHCLGTDHRIVVRDSIMAKIEAPQGSNCPDASIQAKRNWTDIPALKGQQGHLTSDSKVLYSWIRSIPRKDYRLYDPLPSNKATRRLSKLGRWGRGDAPHDIDGRRWLTGSGFAGADQSKLSSSDTLKPPGTRSPAAEQPSGRE